MNETHRFNGMSIGQRLKELRESKKFSQGDLEKRTGLNRCFTAHVENGHCVPTIETLEKYARALEVPMYQFFCESDQPPQDLDVPAAKSTGRMWSTKGKERHQLRELLTALS